MRFYVSLVKLAVETYIKDKKIIKPGKNLPEEFFNKKAGVFVTIIKNGALRGCIGTYSATRRNIAEEIIHNAISAATEDYRFGPIQKEELPHLSYTVYILGMPELVGEFDPAKWASPKIRRILFDRVNPQKYGIIVKSQGFIAGSDPIFNPAPKPYQKTGLLLPGLKGINTAEQQILIACQKGGIDPKREKIIIYKFTVEKFG